MIEKAKQLLLNNRRFHKKFMYTVPSPKMYPNQWLWDSCFHAIVLRHFDIKAAKQEILSLIQKPLPSGNLPHMIYWKKSKKFDLDWGPKGTSSITQPPIIAYSAERVFEKSHDVKFLEKIFPAMKKYYDYLLTRDIKKDNIVPIINPDESGEDNSPRFDSSLNIKDPANSSKHAQKRRWIMKKYKECNFNDELFMQKYFAVKDVPFNCILIKSLESMNRIAKEIGEGKKYSKKIKSMKKSMRKLMFDKTDEVYYSLTFNNEKIKLKTYAIFMPLFSGLLTKKEAKRLVGKHLLNKKEFWTNYPIPCVAMNEKAFSPTKYWRGPAWINVNWFVYHGLLKYGFDDIAEKLKEKTEELIKKSGFREYYNPFSGFGLGAANYGWSTLVVDMIKE